MTVNKTVAPTGTADLMQQRSLERATGLVGAAGDSHCTHNSLTMACVRALVIVQNKLVYSSRTLYTHVASQPNVAALQLLNCRPKIGKFRAQQK